MGNGSFGEYVDPINTSGEFIGSAVGNGSQEGILWSTSGADTVLQSSASASFNAINASGEVVGEDGSNLPVIWSATGAETSLPQPTNVNGPYAFAAGIDAKGDVVGGAESTLSDGNRGMEAVYWASNAQGQAPVILSADSTAYPGYDQYWATSINNYGVIGGGAGIGGAGGCHATEWSTNGSVLWSSPDSDGNPSAVLKLNASGTGLGFDGSNAAEWSSTGKETILTSAPGESGACASLMR